MPFMLNFARLITKQLLEIAMTRVQAFILFALIVIIWGANWTVVKLIVESIPPIWSNAIRSIIAAIALLIVQIATRQFMIPKRHDLPAIMIVGLFHMTCFATLMAIGLQYTSVGYSAILGYSTPLWVTPMAILFLQEPVNKLRLFGVFLGIIGVIVLFAPTVSNLQTSNAFLGNALLLIASVCWAVAMIGIKVVKWHATPFQLVFWQTLLAAILSSIIALYFEGIPKFELNNNLIWQCAYNGLLSTAFGFWAMTVINRHLPAVVTSLGLLATPIVGIAFSQYILGEKPDIQLIVSGCLIIVGIALGSINVHKKIIN